MQFFWICLGGAAGTGARYLLSGWTTATFGAAFAWGTLVVNVLGSFLIAVLMVAANEANLLSPTLRLALTTGVMGGFTTYSAFSYETMLCFQQGAWGTGALNIVVTVVGCLVACLLGLWCGRALFV